MSLLATILLAVSCVATGHAPGSCAPVEAGVLATPPHSAQAPQRTPEAIDVLVTAQAAIAWDVPTGTILYERNASVRRPVASLTKLLSVLLVRDLLPLTETVEIPSAVQKAQREGAHIRLPVGEHGRVDQLLAASLVASANDAIVTLAVAATAEERFFVERANQYAATLGLKNTRVANATGLPGGDQYSTARDVQRLLTLVYNDAALRPYLDDAAGSLVTAEGTTRAYTSTNDLLATYLPIIAAKTGYTLEAGENVALVTRVQGSRPVGIVILGSEQRFQDAKILAEWIDRHYSWPH